MDADYRVWLNGNSLVLIADSVSPEQADALLDIQLAAYLNACHVQGCSRDERSKKYLEVQAGFGCVFTALQHQGDIVSPEVPCIPWRLLLASLLPAFDTPFANGLAAFVAQHERTMQRLWRKSVKRMGECGHVHSAELRLVLPETLFSSELSFVAEVPQGPKWREQVLAPTSLCGLNLVTGRYAVDWATVECVRDGLRDKLGEKNDVLQQPMPEEKQP